MAIINLTESDNNKAIAAVKGDKVVITLAWKPSTGYFWQDAETTAGTLEQVKHDGDNPTPGASALVVFTIRIENSGVIELYCARPWEETKRPAKWFTVTVS